MNIFNNKIKEVEQELEQLRFLYREVDEEGKRIVKIMAEERTRFLKTMRKAYNIEIQP